MKIPFINYAGLEKPTKQIQEWIHYHALGIVAAPQGAGLTRFLEHCVLSSEHKVASIQLFEPNKAQIRSLQLASSATAVAFSLLWSQLNRLNRPHSDLHKLPNYSTSIAPLTDRDFLKAYDSILSILENARSTVDAIIVDNAHLGDAKLFTILMQLIDECRIPPALILGVRLEEHATPDEALQRYRRVVPALEQRRKPILALEKISYEIFDREILPLLLLNSHIDLDSRVEEEQDRVANELWTHIRGNWHRIHQLYTALQIHVTPRLDQTWLLSWEGYQQVLQELKGNI